MTSQNEKQLDETTEAAERIEIPQPVTEVFPLYSTILIVCFVTVSIVQFIVDAQDTTFAGNKSIELAAFVKPLFLAGQYWRILTAGVMHAGAAHLFFNSYATYVFGRPFETLSNRSHLIIVFLLAVIGGGLLSLAFQPTGASIGASGGIIGLLGYLTVYALKRRKILSSDLLKNLLINIGLITVVGVAFMGNIDNLAHLGGFLTGGVYGLLQVSSDIYKDPRIVGKATDTIGKIALGIIFATCVFSILVMFEVIKIDLNLLLLP